MVGLQRITSLSEKFLVDILGLEYITEVEDYINNNFIIGYEIIIKQIIFEVFYTSYINDTKEGKSIIDVYKRNFKEIKDIKSYECADDKEYAKFKRSYKEFRKYNDELAIKYKKEQDVQYLNIDANDVKKKMQGQQIRQYQESQLLDINEFPIFKYIKDRRITNAKSLDDYTLITSLKDLDKVYERINTRYCSYFERSVQYFQLETSCRIETNYLIANAIKKVKRSLAEKKNDIKKFQCFIAVRSELTLLENKFIMGIEKYMNEYMENPEVIRVIPDEIYILNLVKFKVRKLVLDEVAKTGEAVNYFDNDDFFKKYFGEGQHIINNKGWENIKLKDFRDLYVSE